MSNANAIARNMARLVQERSSVGRLTERLEVCTRSQPCSVFNRDPALGDWATPLICAGAWADWRDWGWTALDSDGEHMAGPRFSQFRKHVWGSTFTCMALR